MIYAWVDKDGNEILMTPEEAREANRDFGLTDLDQEFIRAIEAGEIDGDVELLDDDGNIIREPRTPDEASQIEPTDQPVTLPFSGPKSERSASGSRSVCKPTAMKSALAV